ncbi:MAG: AmmeMemoRadiSam system radical SAM enzyme [Planctomycetota bacterium]
MPHSSYEAKYYEPLDDDRVQCHLCPHECKIEPGNRGICRQRENDGGTLVSRNYARVTSAAMDPIEKKPLYHFHPGVPILSLGTNGCNFRCRNCQNWTISQQDADTQELEPSKAVRLASEHGSFGIAYTYNEPLIWYEYVLDTAKLARDAGLKNVLVTNGFTNPEPFAELLPFVDAMNIDLKSIRDEFYRTICGGRLDPVLETAKTANESTHVEVTNLVIPTHNDSDDDLTELADWIRDNLGPDTPAHLSGYTPRYELHAPPTDPDTLRRAYGIFTARLHHVYVGNVILEKGTDTVCRGCGATLIRRRGFAARIVGLDGSRCAACGAELNIVV